MILGALAYRSAKKRKLGELRVLSPGQGIVLEVALLLVICLLVLAQKNLKELVATDPFNNVFIPLWAIFAYLFVILSPGWPTAETAAPKRQEEQTLEKALEEDRDGYEAGRSQKPKETPWEKDQRLKENRQPG